LDSTPEQKRNQNPFRRAERICRSTDHVLQSMGRSTKTKRESMCVNRSTVPVDRSLATVDWVVNRAVLVHVVQTGRPSGWSGSVLAYCKPTFSLLLVF